MHSYFFSVFAPCSRFLRVKMSLKYLHFGVDILVKVYFVTLKPRVPRKILMLQNKPQKTEEPELTVKEYPAIIGTLLSD